MADSTAPTVTIDASSKRFFKASNTNPIASDIQHAHKGIPNLARSNRPTRKAAPIKKYSNPRSETKRSNRKYISTLKTPQNRYVITKWLIPRTKIVKTDQRKKKKIAGAANTMKNKALTYHNTPMSQNGCNPR